MRARIAHELHDTLLQGFLVASMLLGRAVGQTPVDSASMPALSRALRLVRQAIDEGRAAIRGVHQASPAGSSLEHAFSNLLSETTTERDLRLRIFVCGKPWTLDSAIQEQLFLIGREAIINALRHSHATKIEVEIQYGCHCLHSRILPVCPAARSLRALACWDFGWARHCDARHTNGRQPKSRTPVRARFALWTHGQALGVPVGSDGRSRSSTKAAQDSSTASASAHAQTMWH